MFDYISGEIEEISPSFIVIDAANIGYFINISLTTYENLNNQKKAKVFIHQVLREDTNDLYGFFDKNEREIFRQLISVSGIGANTARLMLSSLKPEQIIEAIETGDVPAIKSVKGIGAKTAQRVIVDLKDKVGKMKSADFLPFQTDKSSIVEEAVSALTMLGFNKKNSENSLRKILQTNKNLTVEELVKIGIKKMSK